MADDTMKLVFEVRIVEGFEWVVTLLLFALGCLRRGLEDFRATYDLLTAPVWLSREKIRNPCCKGSVTYVEDTVLKTPDRLVVAPLTCFGCRRATLDTRVGQ
jgi:hypothetical protein